LALIFELTDCPLQRFGIASNDHDATSFSCEFASDGEPNSTAAASDQSAFTVKL
jgi:hypothetical protein